MRNFIFSVPIESLPQFVAAISDKVLDARSLFVARVAGACRARRSSPAFWSRIHDVNRYLVDTDPVQAG